MELTAFPSSPVVEVNFSDVPVLSIGFPEVPVSVLPEGFIPNVPWFTVFAGSGSGAATVRAGVAARMVASASGSTQVAPRGVVAAAASGSGKLAAPAYVVGQAFPTSIEASGVGDKVVKSSAVSSVAATGSGTLTASPGTTIPASGQSSTLTPAAGAVRATGAGTGTSTFATAARITAAASGVGTPAVTGSIYGGAGMDKSGNQTLAGSTWTQITSWTARSGSTVVSNGLMLPANISATAIVQVTYGGSNAVNTCRVLADGVVVGTAPAGGQTVTGTFTIPAAATAQLITVEGYVAGLTGGRAVAASGTFLTLT